MPLSLPLLAATAPEYNYRLVDLLWEKDAPYGCSTDLVGISMRFSAEKRAYAIADEYRKRGVPVVIGGPQATMMPWRAEAHADAVALGEGEPLWPTIVQDAQQRRLRKFYVTSPVPFDAKGRTLHQVEGFADLSAIRPALRRLYRKRYVFDTVFAVRGCPVCCDFCSVPLLHGKEFRQRPIEHVVAEIDTFRNYYYILDDTVFGRPATYDYYLGLYGAITKLRKRRYWTGQGNLDAAADPRGREVIVRAADAGLLYAAIGMESVDPAVLVASGTLRKNGARSPEEALDAMRANIRYIQSRGIVVSGWFVVGYDQDTPQTYERTVAFCREMNILPVIFPLCALPGTALRTRLEQEGRLREDSLFNIKHPSITTEVAAQAQRSINRSEYSLSRNLRRSIYYMRTFCDDRIHKFIFSMVTQAKMGGAIGISADALFRA